MGISTKRVWPISVHLRLRFFDFLVVSFFSLFFLFVVYFFAGPVLCILFAGPPRHQRMLPCRNQEEVSKREKNFSCGATQSGMQGATRLAIVVIYFDFLAVHLNIEFRWWCAEIIARCRERKRSLLRSDTDFDAWYCKTCVRPIFFSTFLMC